VANVTAYLPPDYRAQSHWRFEVTLDPAWSHHALVYALPRDLRADQPIYLAVAHPGNVPPMGVRVVDEHSYRVDDLAYVRTNTFFASVLVSMVLVILCFWLVLRDRMFVYFIVYVTAEVVYSMYYSGELSALPGAALLAPFLYRSGMVAAPLAMAFSIWFILDFAELRRCTPRLARWLGALRWFTLLYTGLVCLLPAVPAWLINSFNLALAAACLLSLVASWRAWRQGNRQAGFFLLSWVPLLTLAIVRVVQLIALFPLPEWLAYGFPASMAWSAVIITVGLADRTLQVRHERDQATRLAQFDPLTGVLNRRAIMETLHAAWDASTPNHAHLAVLFLDIDHFKQINDSRGHAAGDACLRAVTDAVRAELGEGDSVGRYGGEEFLVMLRGDRALAATQVAERIVARVAAMRVEAGGAPIALTASIGVAVREPSTTSVEALVEAADGAQYQAKAEGRNRVVDCARAAADREASAVAG
jgi:diguanylate cyclase (GGDEF)-like protein